MASKEKKIKNGITVKLNYSVESEEMVTDFSILREIGQISKDMLGEAASDVFGESTAKALEDYLVK